ncbi:DoxX family protein [Nocardioides coralli]|uniref:DoxX family protein n=1 Tax=Nocardioides coralli TaxID=2872154 RepID=UPI001CA3AC5F|nr:DoxX family protein [Nocardioides coralli]QZY29728.1 DoxX family protein [Nocardioides coralli]
MNIFLWVLTVGLAVAFLGAGVMKLTRTKEDLHQAGMGWVEDFSQPTIRMIGVLELLAVVGLILPAVLDIATVVVPLAALGLVLLMLAAAGTHVRRGEWQYVGVTSTLLVLAAVVTYGRFGPAPVGG